MNKNRYPPFCVHFYPKKYTDFHICSRNFESYEEVLDYASKNFDGYLFRIGYWYPEKYPERYFYLEEVDI